MPSPVIEQLNQLGISFFQRRAMIRKQGIMVASRGFGDCHGLIRFLSSSTRGQVRRITVPLHFDVREGLLDPAQFVR